MKKRSWLFALLFALLAAVIFISEIKLYFYHKEIFNYIFCDIKINLIYLV